MHEQSAQHEHSARHSHSAQHEHSAQTTDSGIEYIVHTYSNMLFKLCFSMLCNNADAEDAVEDTFVKYITKNPQLQDEEHTKAWLIRVATNVCKDLYRFNKRRDHLNIDDIQNYCKTEEHSEILEAVMSLPEKFRIIIHLFYIEGYKTDEIARILSISPSAVRKRLQYARNELRFQYQLNAEPQL